ncbi:MAG TPA: cupin domain-containing protein [Spirochaetota bacterium]|nr:cupin domain-containing protein [Spirochaetota bacterium]
MEIRNIDSMLKHAHRDSAAGIRLAKTAGDDVTAMFVAEIDPHTKLRAHHHMSGDEIYVILDGHGVMHTREAHPVNEQRVIPPVISTAVAADDVFTIKPGVIHSLENTGDTPMRALFICPESHVGADRFFTEELS